jgi:hypothetical protein
MYEEIGFQRIFDAEFGPNKDMILRGRRLQNFLAPFSCICTGLDRDLFRAFADRIKLAFQQHTLCTTETGLIGMVPKSAVKGDKTAVLFGCDYPVDLRAEGDERYKVVGVCHVEGIMPGEVVENIISGIVSVQDIALC